MAQANSDWAAASQLLVERYDAALAAADLANTNELNNDRDQITGENNTANTLHAQALDLADYTQSVAYAQAAGDVTRDTAQAAAQRQYNQTSADVAYQTARVSEANQNYNNNVAATGMVYVEGGTIDGNTIPSATQTTDRPLRHRRDGQSTPHDGYDVYYNLLNGSSDAFSNADLSSNTNYWNSTMQDLAANHSGDIGDGAGAALAHDLGEAQVSYAGNTGDANIAYATAAISSIRPTRPMRQCGVRPRRTVSPRGAPSRRPIMPTTWPKPMPITRRTWARPASSSRKVFRPAVDLAPCPARARLA